MCWYTFNSKEDTLPVVVQVPVPVYKIMWERLNSEGQKTLSSLYFYQHYREGEVFSQEKLNLLRIVGGLEPFYKIERGFHSYSEKDTKVTWFKDIKTVGIFHISDGLWAQCMDCVEEQDMASLKLVFCELPVGATYYQNSLGEIVSDKIKIKESVYLKDLFKESEKANKVLTEIITKKV